MAQLGRSRLRYESPAEITRMTFPAPTRVRHLTQVRRGDELIPERQRHEGMDQPGRRWVLGMASQSVLVAFQIVAANLRKITGFLQEVAEQEWAAASNRRHRSRRRRTKTLAERTEVVSSREGPIRAPPG